MAILPMPMRFLALQAFERTGFSGHFFLGFHHDELSLS
jgi:hypothetical protein